jgi:hypothetical protein
MHIRSQGPASARIECQLSQINVGQSLNSSNFGAALASGGGAFLRFSARSAITSGFAAFLSQLYIYVCS